MSTMFYLCSSLTDLNIGSFDTSNMISMKSMFDRCNSLETITLGNRFTKWLNSAYVSDGIWNKKELYYQRHMLSYIKSTLPKQLIGVVSGRKK